MTRSIAISSLDEINGWRETLVVLAIERWQPLLSDAGVPSHIANSPAILQLEAARFWQANLALQSVRSLGHEDYRQTMEAMLSEFFAQTAVAYSSDATTSLHQWALRQYVDHRQRNAYLLWSQVLRRLAGIAGLGYPLHPVPQAVFDSERFTYIIEKHLALQLQRDDAARIADCVHTSASSMERLLAVRESMLLESVEESLPEALTNQRAYRALLDLSKEMNQAAKVIFLECARVQAVAMQMPPEQIFYPHEDAASDGDTS